MNAENEMAQIEVCKCLNSEGGALSWETINRRVFYNMVRENDLKALLRQMVDRNLIIVLSNKTYRLTSHGQRLAI